MAGPLLRRDVFAKGRELHRRIPPERWCITLRDLADFERGVRVAWRKGAIPRDAVSSSDGHDDPSIGPSMYVVCEHFIKPATRNAGGMSYALMLHPNGLECDVFATHAWAEGVFEFCSKVRRAWPSGGRHLWCCFLANPQLLDIGFLLDVPPERSPFARALDEATHVIVIPNHSVSIYERLWCVYEAYLAVTTNKRIRLPKVASRGPVCRALFLHFLLPFVVGLGVLYVLNRYVPVDSNSTRFNVLHLLNELIGCLLVLLRWLEAPRWRGLSIGLALYVTCLAQYQDNQMLVCLSLLGLVVVYERVQLEAVAHEASQLTFSSVRHARCSSEVDRERIEEAITGKEEEVDQAIRTLMKCGVFDKELGQLIEAGVHIRSGKLVGFWRFAACGFVLWLLAWWDPLSAVDLVDMWDPLGDSTFRIFAKTCKSTVAQEALVVACVVAALGGLAHSCAMYCKPGFASKTMAARLLFHDMLLYYVMPWDAIKNLLGLGPCEITLLQTGWFATVALIGPCLSWLGPLRLGRCRERLRRCQCHVRPPERTCGQQDEVLRLSAC